MDFNSVGCLGYWFIYATNWTQCIVSTYIVLSILNLCTEGWYVAWTRRCCWVFQDCALVASTIVTILTWYGCLYLGYSTDFCHVDQKPYTLVVHGFNCIYMIIDYTVVKREFAPNDIIYPFIMSFVYFVWTYVHHYLQIGICVSPHSNAPIYSSIRWDDDVDDKYNVGEFAVLMVPVMLIYYVFTFILRRTNQTYNDMFYLS